MFDKGVPYGAPFLIVPHTAPDHAVGLVIPWYQRNGFAPNQSVATRDLLSVFVPKTPKSDVTPASCQIITPSTCATKVHRPLTPGQQERSRLTATRPRADPAHGPLLLQTHGLTRDGPGHQDQRPARSNPHLQGRDHSCLGLCPLSLDCSVD